MHIGVSADISREGIGATEPGPALAAALSRGSRDGAPRALDGFAGC